MPDVRADRDQWSVLIPVKRLDAAKTRIAIPATARADLALAMAADTVRAALGAEEVAEVIVITSDERARSALGALGARVIDDQPDAGLNPALQHGATLAVSPKVAALSADLPALASADLDRVLCLAAEHPVAVVADAGGIGTTVLTALGIDNFGPAFGAGSRAAHVAAGAVDLTADAAPALRHDVDTLEALEAAIALGVGTDTTRAVRALWSEQIGRMR
jgi:2-phospho-L-lactate/phosphoenolpyruvate guanylyltransferase